jgi:gas vesicle protein
MWHREVQVRRDYFWTGLLTGIIVGGVLGVFLGSESGHRTRSRLEDAAMRVRSKMNGAAEKSEPLSEESTETEDQPSET